MAPVQSKVLSAEDAGEALPKWAWPAVIVGGIAVTAAVAYVFFGGDSKVSSAPKKKKKDAKTTPKKAAAAAVKVEDVNEEEELPTDPFERAVQLKNKGNKYFKGGRFELAIKCYSEAIEICPAEKKTDLSTFYQNRAAANDQLENLEGVITDCGKALELNTKYVKALDRRSKALRKKAQKSSDDQETIDKLKMSLEDLTAVCILEGFQKQEHLMLVDTVLKELGRAEAKVAMISRQPSLPSDHFISQYFQSFAEDPIMRFSSQENGEQNGENGENGESNENGISEFVTKIRNLIKEEKFSEILPACDAEIESEESTAKAEAVVTRATFLILSKSQEKAKADLTTVIEDEEASKEVRVNALVKRASLFIQQCKDPQTDPELSLKDFARAIEIDAGNTDIYHHRGQVHLLLDDMDKALSDFTKAVELRPDFPIAYVQKLYTEYRKASTASNSSEVARIVDQFEDAVEKFPRCVESFALFAQVLSDQGKFDRAEEVYLKAQKVDPRNANIFVHRGLISLQSKGDIVTSASLIQKALEIDDKCEFAYETLGTIEVQRGNMAKAIELFDKAIPLANTELEVAHLYGLRDAARAQITVTERLGITLPNMGNMGMA